MCTWPGDKANVPPTITTTTDGRPPGETCGGLLPLSAPGKLPRAGRLVRALNPGGLSVPREEGMSSGRETQRRLLAAHPLSIVLVPPVPRSVPVHGASTPCGASWQLWRREQ